MIAHHLDLTTVLLEVIGIVLLLCGFAAIWWRERRRRLRGGGTARMRDENRG